jgi:hypothetical protein
MRFVDPSGYTSTSRDHIINIINALYNSPYGGHWTIGGNPTYFTSADEALQYSAAMAASGGGTNDADGVSYFYFSRKKLRNRSRIGISSKPVPGVDFNVKFTGESMSPESIIGLSVVNPNKDEGRDRMGDGEDGDLWNSRPARILLPDNISVNVTFAGGFMFSSVTYSVNFLTRGKDPGVYFSKTEMDKMFGIGFLSGPSIGLHFYQKKVNELNSNELFGKTQSGAGSIIWGGGAQFPHDANGKLMWIGIDIPFFPGIGGMGGTGHTSPIGE